MNNSLHCKVCNKYYSSKSSLCNHNKRFHMNNISCGSQSVVNCCPNGSQSVVNCCPSGSQLVVNNNNDAKKPKLLPCKYCSTEFKDRSNRWRHEKICKEKERQEREKEEEKARIDMQTELLIKEQEATILKLKLKLQNSNKAEPVTLNKLNRMLTEHHNTINRYSANSALTDVHNSEYPICHSTIDRLGINRSNVHSNNNNTIHNNVQNNITNNYQIVGFGKEEGIPTLLTDLEKQTILNFRLLSLQKLIEIVHCGNYDQFKNIIITNMKDNYMYKYDDKKGIFVMATKDEMLNTLVNYRIDDLEIIFNEYVEQNKINDKTKERIEDFINKMNGGDDEFRKYHINEIKLLLFNNKDKITNDISIMLTVNEVK